MKTYDQHLLLRVAEEKETRKKIELSGERTSEPNLYNISAALDEYYFFNKLRVYCAERSYQYIINPDKVALPNQSVELIEEILQQVNQFYADNSILSTYVTFIHILNGMREEGYNVDSDLNTVLRLQDVNEPLLSIDESIEIYSLLSNICIYWMNTRQAQLGEKMIEINLRIIKLLVRHKEPVPQSLYANLIITAIHAPEYSLFEKLQPTEPTSSKKHQVIHNRMEWIKVFMEYYKIFLSDKARKYHYPYCKALWYYQQEEFAQAYKLLKNFQPRGVFIGLDAKVLYLKTLYEIYEKQELGKHKGMYVTEKEMRNGIEAYKSQLKYEKSARQLLAYQLEFYERFDILFRRLYNFHNHYAGVYNLGNERFKSERDSVVAAIRAVSFSYKDWLLDKTRAVK